MTIFQSLLIVCASPHDTPCSIQDNNLDDSAKKLLKEAVGTRIQLKL